MFFEGRKKTGKGNAQRVKAGDKFTALKNSQGIRQQNVRSCYSRGFGSKLHTCAHLRRARRTTHHSSKLAEDRLRLRRHWLHNKQGNASGQDQGPQGSETPLFHVTLPPRRSARLSLDFLRRLHRKISGPRNRLIRMP